MLGAAALVAVGAVLVPTGAALAAPGDPFDPAVPTVFIGQESPTQLYTAVQGAGEVTFEPTGPVADRTYNAIGFNSTDNYLYGLRVDNGFKTALQRIGQDGQVTGLGVVTGLPTPSGSATDAYNQGSFGSGATAGILYVRSQFAPNSMWAVDVASLTATAITLSGAGVPNVSDITWKDGFLWGMYNNDRMYRINPATGQVDSWVTGLGTSGDFGAQWQYGNGNIGISRNADGRVFQIAIDNPSSATPGFRLVSSTTGPQSSNNDGASIPGQPVDLALTKTGPASYTVGQTITYTLTVTNNGPGASSGSVVTDPVPAALTGVASVTEGCTVDGNALSCTLGALAPSETTTITVTGTVADSAVGNLSNTATVTGNEQDPTPANNSDRWTIVPEPFVSTTPPEPNPPLPAMCELDLAITLDMSNSIGDSQLQAMRDGVAYLGEALSDYPVRLALHNFASYAPATSSAANAPLLLTELDDAGVQAVADWATGIERPDSTYGNTNWEQAFAAVNAAPDAYDALLFVTDGNPTAIGNPPVNNYTAESLTAAVESANALKGEGTRIVGVGLADNLTVELNNFRSHMSQVSGPVEGDDYMLTRFSELADTIIALVDENCEANAVPAITLEKTANLADGATGAVGDTVEYTFTATNTGDQTLTGVVIDDPKPGLSALDYTWPGEPGVLEPGESVTATATYQVTESDRDNRIIQNSATVSGNPPTGPPVTDEDTADVTLPDSPAIELVKTGAIADGDAGVSGDTIEYTFTVTNTGNVTLTERRGCR